MEFLLIDAFRDSGLPAENLAATALAVVQGGYVLARVHADPAYLRRAVDGLCALLADHDNASVPTP